MFLILLGLSGILSAGELNWPLEPGAAAHSVITSYGQYVGFYHNQIHMGVDIAASPYEPVFTVQDGIVKCFTDNSAGGIYWFMIVTIPGDSSQGWCYTHIATDSFHVSPGDSVHAGQLIGHVVPWTGDFNHLHLDYFDQLPAGTPRSEDLRTAVNCLSLLKGSGDTCPPFFHDSAGEKFYFYDDFTGLAVSAMNLRGKIRVSVGAGDFSHDSPWPTGIYSLFFWIRDSSRAALSDTATSVVFNFPLGNTLEADDSSGEAYDLAHSARFSNYYFLGRSDSASRLRGKTTGYIDTRAFPNGLNYLYVMARDFDGNSAIDSIPIIIDNIMPGAEPGRNILPPGVVRAFPNPFDREVSIRFPGPMESWNAPVFSMVDASGRSIGGNLIYRRPGPPENAVRLIWNETFLPKGVYFLDARWDGRRQVLKLVHR